MGFHRISSYLLQLNTSERKQSQYRRREGSGKGKYQKAWSSLIQSNQDHMVTWTQAIPIHFKMSKCKVMHRNKGTDFCSGNQKHWKALSNKHGFLENSVFRGATVILGRLKIRIWSRSRKQEHRSSITSVFGSAASFLEKHNPFSS